MHIPDGFLDIPTAVVTYAIFLLYGYYAIRKIRNSQFTEYVPFVSVLAAGIFAVQMLNWPLPGGTSLHFVGGGLAGIMLGPWLGFMAMFLVLLVQALVFHDGGITTLGANVINMAIVPVLLGYFIYWICISKFKATNSKRSIGAFLGGWIGIAIAGAIAGLQIGYSHSFPYGVSITLPIMAGLHAILGIIEGVITSFVILYLVHKAPHLILTGRRVTK